MTHGSLFSGIGGFDLAAEWMGWENVFHCEKEPFCQRVLKYYWPKTKLYDDITTTDFTIHWERIDILTGGFPCQPYSQAGKRLGKEDDRHLWPEMLRAVREISPRWVVGENVRGIINWNGGLVFNEVQADLEAEGYQVQPFLLPAAGVGAPHRRDRIWFVAHSKRVRPQRWTTNNGLREKTPNGQIEISICGHQWENFIPQSRVCSGNDGIPSELDGIAFPKWRGESIKGYGSAVVPQVVYQIFRAIEQYKLNKIQ